MPLGDRLLSCVVMGFPQTGTHVHGMFPTCKCHTEHSIHTVAFSASNYTRSFTLPHLQMKKQALGTFNDLLQMSFYEGWADTISRRWLWMSPSTGAHGESQAFPLQRANKMQGVGWGHGRR